MKQTYATLLVTLIVAVFTQPIFAQSHFRNEYYANDLSDFLDLEAVITVFSHSRNLNDFERQLNDYRNEVSNLDLNGDGFVDYLRTIKLSDRNSHIILIQAVLGRNFYQDVATIVVGRNRFGREFIQFIGDPGLYGYNYIIEPEFRRRPAIARWLWRSSPHHYVSRYSWDYYPSFFRLRPLVEIHIYHQHIYHFRDAQVYLHFHSRPIYAVPVEIIRPYHRNDFWRENRERQFEYRHQNIQNRRELQPEQRNSENQRRERPSQREQPRRTETPVTIPERRNQPTETRPIRQPQRHESQQPQREQTQQPRRTETPVTVPERRNEPTETRPIRQPQRHESQQPQREQTQQPRRTETPVTVPERRNVQRPETNQPVPRSEETRRQESQRPQNVETERRNRDTEPTSEERSNRMEESARGNQGGTNRR